MGTEISRLGGYGFRGTVTAGDKFNQREGESGAAYVNLRGKRKRQQRKVGRKKEGSNLNRSELAALVLALSGIPVTKTLLYLCDNQALLKAVKRWVGEGRKVTFVGSTKRRHFIGSSRRAPKRNRSSSCDVSSQGESASKRTCK